MVGNGGREGYTPTAYVQGNTDNYQEIAWNTTNSVSQWCLNAIMCLEFIPEFLPERIWAAGFAYCRNQKTTALQQNNPYILNVAVMMIKECSSTTNHGGRNNENHMESE